MQSFFLWFSTFIASGVTMYIVTKGCFALFQKYHIVDKPHLYPHEKHRKPLPYPGGIVLSINLVLWTPWILYAVADADIKKAAYVIIAGVLTSLVMAWDDQTRSLPPLPTHLSASSGSFFGVTAIKIGYMTHIFGGIIHLDQFSHLQFLSAILLFTCYLSLSHVSGMSS